MIIKLSNPMEAIRDGWKDGKREIDARVGKGVQVFDECVCVVSQSMITKRAPPSKKLSPNCYRKYMLGLTLATTIYSHALIRHLSLIYPLRPFQSCRRREGQSTRSRAVFWRNSFTYIWILLENEKEASRAKGGTSSSSFVKDGIKWRLSNEQFIQQRDCPCCDQWLGGREERS